MSKLIKQEIIDGVLILLFSLLLTYVFFLLFRASGWVTSEECESQRSVTIINSTN